MKMRKHVEWLEKRVLLSVSDTVLSGPLTTGLSYPEEFLASGQPTTYSTVQVLGPTTYNGQSTIAFETTSSTSTYKDVTEAYYRLDPSAGYVTVAEVDTTTDSNGSSRLLTNLYSPATVNAPVSLTAGVTYTSYSTDTSTEVIQPGNQKGSEVFGLKSTAELLPGAMQAITVPAGTFPCYEFILTNTFTPPTGAPVVDTFDVWASPGIGLVKRVAGGVTLEITQYPPLTPAKLAFKVNPGPSITDGTISPAPTVQVENSAGQVSTGDASEVKLAILSGPAGATLEGATSVAAVFGVATFSKISLSKPGTYELVATDGKLSSADSAKFVVSVPDKLAFESKPTTGVAGKDLSPAVAVELLSGSTIDTGDTSSVTLTISSGPAGGKLDGTLTVVAVKGIATFAKLTFSAAGTYVLKATDGNLTAVFSQKIDIAATTAAAAPPLFPTIENDLGKSMPEFLTPRFR